MFNLDYMPEVILQRGKMPYTQNDGGSVIANKQKQKQKQNKK